MTGPDPGGYERGTGAPTRSTGTQRTVGAILIVLALGLALRLILAYLLPGSGFDSDLASFRGWASDLARNGLDGFYKRDFFHDYTPGYLYVLWLVGTIGGALGGIGDLIKIPPILADIALGYLVHSMIRELGGRERLALLGAVVVIVNPVLWFDSVVWGQVDSVGVVFLLLGLRSLWRDQPERAAIYTVIAAVVKPQLGILVPLVAVVTIRRAVWPVDAGAGAELPAVTVLDRIRRWEARTGHPARILTTAAAGYLTAVVLCAPFGLSVLEVGARAPFIASDLIDQVVVAGSGYPYLTVNAYNVWAIIPSDLGNSLANAGLWVCDAAPPADAPDRCSAGVARFGPMPAIAVGTGLLVVSILTVLVVAARRPDRLTLLVALAVLAVAFFAAPTRVHERYGFPFFALGAILFAVSPRWRAAYAVLSIATFANMYVVLTTLYPPGHPDLNPVRDWLGIGSALRSEIGVTTIALLHTAAFGWVWLQLRSGARARLREGFAEARLAAETRTAVETRMAAETRPEPALMVSQLPLLDRRPFAELGFVSWVRDRMRDRPIRADRSRALVGERGGRLDRLDAWFLVVLVLATLGMRTFRLAEPYQMHFDEVYHARTATEFLQAWRYGQTHDIYEWTHPHLAKYAIAGGIALWGADDVRATSRLDTPVRAVAIEHRRTDPLDGVLAGERVHIATGDIIRTEDLRTRATVGRISAPGASALALDITGDRLIVGFDDGSIATVGLDDIGPDGATDQALTAVTSVEHPIRQLLVTDDGALIIAASDTTVTAVDLRASTDPQVADDPMGSVILGSAELPAIADLANAGTGSTLLATPSEIDQPSAAASILAKLIDGDPADIEARLAEAAPDGTVVLGSPGSGETRTAVEAAIADGRLAGIEIVELPRVAVANADGVAFIDPTTTGVSSTIEMVGGARGLALVIGIDDPKLYVTTGTATDPAYAIVAVGGDQAANGPTEQRRHPMPGLGTRVAYNEATQQVHVMGRVPGPTDSRDAGWTVYVIEPHANAVYADAELPTGLEPAGWALDVESQYPSDDRQDLLVFGADGQTASIDVGSHAFAWRLPGVIAGVLMAVCLYVLARILFQRRLVAGLVGLFVVLDGMLFVQSRIAMNDVYVGLFIIAAYTVFAALWTGWWRGRAAFWVALPIIGLLLGLALASKWVAAYAIGALVLLLLVRSALGRVLAILGLVGITSVLGYLAISVPAGQGVGNLLFLAIMVGLTLVAVVAAVFHPITWTDEEMWLAVIVPTAVGAILFFGALALGRLEQSVVVGPLAITPLLGATAAALGSLAVYAAFRVGGVFGYGPLAGSRDPGDPARLLEPATPVPHGWLRPGWLLGLPLVWATVCLVAIPLGVYVASYLPWAAIENHRLWEGAPAGNTGQTLLELTGQMYNYHNGLTSAHPASSPWWAWPFDLKPVWFYQDGFAAGTGAAIYDAGNLVIWWFGFAALVFVSIMAFRRRSPALALIAIGFAAQWVSWARIDRASFQYHYYTALPFVILALAYLVAELWHGASRRTWLAVRIVGAAAVLAPVGLWLFSRPLCGLVGVDIANPGSAACPAIIPDLVLTVRTAALLAVVAVGAYVLARGVLALQGAAAASEGANDTDRGALRGVLVGTAAIAVAFVAVALLPDTPILTWRGIPVEPIALIVALPIVYFAVQVFAARDARRFVVGLGVATVAWFVVWYPNIAALPLPSAVVNAYQGLLPTYLYAFQFPVNTVARTVQAPLLSPTLGVLALAIAVTCLVVAYSASVWRLALAESSARSAGSGVDPDSGASDGEAGGLARTGGGA